MHSPSLGRLGIIAGLFAILAPAVTAASADTAAAGFVACKIHEKRPAVFPIRLLQQGVTGGEATMLLEVSSRGEISDELVLSYTHREFADELRRAAHEWTYEPGVANGEPVVAVLTVTMTFTVNGVLVHERHFDAATDAVGRTKGLAYFPHGVDSLDRPPAAIAKPAPIYPHDWITSGHKGAVTLRFYIDESGVARIPIIVAHADDYLASAAVAAVKQWRFEPPLQHGKPVLAQAEQVFVFEPPAERSKS